MEDLADFCYFLSKSNAMDSGKRKNSKICRHSSVVEHFIGNEEVSGSSPDGGSSKKSYSSPVLSSSFSFDAVYSLVILFLWDEKYVSRFFL